MNIRTRALVAVMNMLLFLMVWTNALSSSGGERTHSPKKVQSNISGVKRVDGIPHYSLLNINNIAMWASDDGMMEQRVESQNAGVTFPRGTGTVVYAGGAIWGGFVHDGGSPVIRVGGQTYSSGMVPGQIIAPGIAENPQNSGVRIYRIRRDWQTADLKQDASEYLGKVPEDVTADDIATVREQYRQDWINWPWQKGAPYYDRDGVSGYQPGPGGAYDSSKDEPGLANADQVLWFVCNDLNSSAALAFAGSPSIGLELQIACWAYNRPDELGNVIFERYRFVYKGTATTPARATIDTMYFAKWVDPDVGDYSDDFAGCIIDKGVGYAYNSRPTDNVYSQFNLSPPVVAYDILQGPVVPQAGSVARWNLSSHAGYANRVMSSFSYFATGGQDADPPFRNYQGSQQWWNLLRGYHSSNGQCYVDPVAGSCTKFPLSGNPITLEGWVDGRTDEAGDRRIALSTGPFQMTRGDTQEVVVGLICALGKTPQDGISKMEGIDGVAQDLINLNFNIPKTPPAPDLRIVELDNKFILDWESDTARSRQIEQYNSCGYKFETYTIYQFVNPATPDKYILFPPFNVVLPRSLQVTLDLIRNRDLVNGQKYYYAVTSTVFNPDFSIARKRIESPLEIKTGVPHSPDPGTVYPYKIGDTVSTLGNLVGLNDAIINAVYVDPTKADGRTYEVLFHHPSPRNLPVWDFIDSTAHDTLLRNMTLGLPPQRLVTRGFTVQVLDAPFGLRNVYETMNGFQSTRNVVFNIPNPQQTYMVLGGGSSQLDTIGGWNVNDCDIEWRFTGDSSWAVWVEYDVGATKWIRVPYTFWQMDRNGGTQARQVYSFITDQAQDSVWRPGVLLDRAYNGQTLRVFYPVSVYVDSARHNYRWYGGSYNDSIPWAPDGFFVKLVLQSIGIGSTEGRYRSGLWKVYIADLDNDGIPAPKGTVIRFVRSKSIFDGDTRLVSPRAVVTDDLSSAEQEVQRIGVFPNPYYGLNRAELGRTQRFVTFNHLPRYSTIRLFNLAGVMVKTIRKDDDTQFASWDLNNENGLPVASGIYIAYIELRDRNGSDLGSTVLKLMIVQEQRFFETR